MSIEPVEFFVRVLPTLDKDADNIRIRNDINEIHIRSYPDLKRENGPLATSVNMFWEFPIDRALENDSQEVVYDTIMPKHLLEKTTDGIDIIIYSFGPSGTGKTYTITGITNKFEYRGIIPRLISDVFRFKKERTDFFSLEVYLTFVEIIDKDVYNLLKRGKPKLITKGIKAYNSSRALPVENECEALGLVFEGESRRNYEKLRTHCTTTVFTLELRILSRLKSNPYTAVTRIHVIDSAGTDFGSNMIKSVKCHTDANLAKTLVNCLSAWSKCNMKHFCSVPGWRMSGLALWLGNSFVAGYKRLVAHIRPVREDIPHIMSTLLYGLRLTQKPIPKLVENKEIKDDMIIVKLQDEIEQLKENLASIQVKSGVYQPGKTSYEEMEHIKRLVTSFFQTDETTYTCLLDTAHPELLLPIMKKVFQDSMKDVITEYKSKNEANIMMNIRGKSSTRATRSSVITADPLLSRKKRISGVIQVGSKASKREVKESIDDKNEYRKETLITSDFLGSFIDDLSQNDQETEEDVQGLSGMIWNEFHSRYPAFKQKLRMIQQNIDSYLQRKADMMNQLTNLHHKLSILRLALEDVRWSNATKIDETGSGEKSVESSEEKLYVSEINNVIDKYNSIRNDIKKIHKKYLALKMYTSEVNQKMELGFNDYVLSVYNTSLILPPAEGSDEASLATVQVSVEEPLEDPYQKCYLKFQVNPRKALTFINVDQSDKCHG